MFFLSTLLTEREKLPPVRTKTLAQFAPGEVGRVISVRDEHHLALHILEIGLTKGAQVRLLRRAPLGDPIQVEVDGFLLSLRKKEAEAVIVEMS
jgi:ferrous iron transport protein A